MAIKDPNRERTRTQMMDAISGLGGADRSVESIDKHILTPLHDVAVKYGYIESQELRDALESMRIASREIKEAIQCLRDGAVRIAQEV